MFTLAFLARADEREHTLRVRLGTRVVFFLFGLTLIVTKCKVPNLSSLPCKSDGKMTTEHQ